MLRVFATTTRFAAALLALSCFGFAGLQQASAADAASCSHCGTTACQCGHAHGHACGKCQQQNCRPRQYGQPELFYNYYVPATCGGVPAALYVAPRPVPAVVGQTYYTYQPFMPHELLYEHQRTYYRYYDNGRGLTRTHISWYRPTVPSMLGGVANHFRIAK